MVSLGFGQVGLSNYSSNIRSPTGIALFEVAASRRVRLMLGVSGSYTKRLRVRSDEEDRSPRSNWLIGGGLGVRWIANPGGPVEIAPALLLGIHGGRTKDIPGTLHESNGVEYDTLGDDASLGADARLGVVTEYALLPNLHLRFEAYFLRAGFERSAVRRNGLTTRTAHMGLNWGIAPSLILRMSI